MPLTVLQIKNAKPEAKDYKLADGGGMYLLVKPNGGKYWRLKYRFQGKEKLLAIGVYCPPPPLGVTGKPEGESVEMTLTEARRRRDEAKTLLASGQDPSQVKQAAKQEAVLASENTFTAVALEWHARSKAKWCEDHAERVWKRIHAHLLPAIGDTPIEDIRTKHLLAALRPVEARGTLDVASRLSQYANAICRYAVQTGRIESNPAIDLSGALSVRKVVHRPALPLNRLPELLNSIAGANLRHVTRYAFELVMLTFLRSSELRMARWHEVDFERAVWTIPAERVPLEDVRYSIRGAKMHTPHVVPLCRQAIAVLRRLQQLNNRTDLVLPGDRSFDKPLSENTLNQALRRMGYATHELCGHGFRTMACSALNESGQWNRDAIERQMSHQHRDSVRAAYMHKAEFLKERHAMMQWWGDFLDAQRAGSYVDPTEFSGGHPTVVPLFRQISG